MDERPFVRSLQRSWALKGEMEWNNWGSLPGALLAEGRAQAIRSAARLLLYL